MVTIKAFFEKLAEKLSDLFMLTLVLLILVLLFRTAMGLHEKANSFTGEIPALPVQIVHDMAPKVQQEG